MVSGIALLQSCAVNKPYSFTPLTVPQIVQMSKDKVPSIDIINEIKKSHTAYDLKASEYAKLQKAGISDSVVNFMQETHLNLIRHDQQVQDSYYWNPGFGGYWYGPGYGWPYAYGYWGLDFGPTIIFRGGGGGHHHGGGGGHYGGNNLR
ncbi:MAG TPA: hypothetical protein DCL77_03270 [Prolixibacteraceae bacterium]|nr:hypothetical protein [Prolixibacteraceae bacterium]